MEKIGLSRMSRRDFLRFSGAVASGALGLPNIPRALSYVPLLSPEQLRNLESSFSDIRYMLALSDIRKVYYGPDDKKVYVPTNKIWQSAVIAVQKLSDHSDFLQVHPDNGVHSNFRLEDNFRNTYVKKSEFREITEFNPINVYPDTQNVDKLVIIDYNGDAPQCFLFEKTRIAAYIPVGLGGYPDNSSTFPADYRVSSIRVTRNMNRLHGVPFTCYYNRTQGKAFHGAPWRLWSLIRKGFFGTAGCINLPCFKDDSLYNVYWNGKNLGFDNFFFCWVKSLFPFDVYKQEMMEVEWNNNDYYNGGRTLRTIVVKEIYDLYKYVIWNDVYPNWDPIVSACLELKEKRKWLVPQQVNGQCEFNSVDAE